MSPVVAIGARLGVEVVGETIEGIFGLASATVTAAGEAAKGVGTAVGGALQGALSPAPVTVVNSVGMAGEAAKAKVTGGGTIPAAPKKSAKPVANAKMPTEKLLVIAVNYLSSIEKTLVDQLNFERTAFAQQATAEREAAIEKEQSTTAPFKSLGEKLGAYKDDVKDRASTMAKVLLGGAALGTFGLLGLGEMDKSELDRLKSAWAEFSDQWKFVTDIIKPVIDNAGWGTFLGYLLFGGRGALAGFLFDYVKKVSGGSDFAAATAGITLGTASGIFGSAARTAMFTTPLGAAGVATAATLSAVETSFTYTQTAEQKKITDFFKKYGLYVEKWSDNGLAAMKYFISIPERNINERGILRATLDGSKNRKDKYYYWHMVTEASYVRGGTATRAQAWLDSKDAQAWLNQYFPIKTDATAVPAASQSQPDAVSSSSISGAPVADAASLANLPPIPADIEKILATIRTKESGGNYGAQNPTSTASGAYQFIDATWRSLSSKYGIGTEYSKAKLAPPEIQDAVAARYAQEILQEAGGDVTKVPIAWFTGNIRGQSTAVSQSEVANYQRSWMDTYTGGQYSGSSYDLQGEGNSMMSSLGDLASGAMEAIGTIAQAAFGKQTPTTGSQLSNFNDNMQGNIETTAANISSAASNGTAASFIQGESDVATQLSRASAQIQTAVDLGAIDKTQAEAQQASASSAFGGTTSSSNDSKREHFDPNFPGKGSIEKYMQYHKPKMAA